MIAFTRNVVGTIMRLRRARVRHFGPPWYSVTDATVTLHQRLPYTSTSQFFQPLVRGWARYFTWLKFKRTPAAVISKPEPGIGREAHSGSTRQLDFWNETGQGRESLITEMVKLLEDEGWRYSTDTGWKSWDVLVYGNLWWSVKVATVTEYHGGPKCLTRARLGLMMVPTTFLVSVILLSTLLYRQIFSHAHDRWLWAFSAAFVAWLLFRGFRLKRRVADLIIHAAETCALKRVSGSKAKPRAAT